MIYSERLYNVFRRRLAQFKKDYKHTKVNSELFVQKLSKKPPWILTVKSEEFEDAEDFERCCREWKTYEAGIKAEKEAKKPIRDGKLSSHASVRRILNYSEAFCKF